MKVSAVALLFCSLVSPSLADDHVDNIDIAAQITASVLASQEVCKYIGIEIDADVLSVRVLAHGVTKDERGSAAFKALVQKDYELTLNQFSKNPADTCYMALSSYGPEGPEYQRGILRTKR